MLPGVSNGRSPISQNLNRVNVGLMSFNLRRWPRFTKRILIIFSMGEKMWTNTIKSGVMDRMLNIVQADPRYSYRDRPAKK
jgi:hypothetical protein